ncbi:MAG: hypothetical protein AABW51_02055 [Nanoarchaeota archaeon]
MEKKKVTPVIMGVFIAVFFGLNFFLYFSKKSGRAPISGAVIGGNLPLGINMTLLAFILQWVILLVVVIFAYTKFLKHRKEEEEKIKDFVIPSPKSKAETNFDVFYNLLKDKKSLNTSTIATAFSISKEQALEWGKILEEHDLVSIEYPAFSDPEVIVTEEKISNESVTEENGDTENKGEKNQDQKTKKEVKKK